MAARGGLRSVRGRKSSLQFFKIFQLTARGAADLNEGLRRGALVVAANGRGGGVERFPGSGRL
jgi:hypothetical protein